MLLKNIGPANQEQSSPEIGIMLVAPWITYLVTDMLGLSGIVSLLGCGIFMALYCLPNMGIKERQSTLQIYEILSHQCELMIYIMMGLSATAFNINFK